MINAKRLAKLIQDLTETTAPVIVSIIEPCVDCWVVVYKRSINSQGKNYEYLRCAIYETRNGELVRRSDMIIKAQG